MTNQEEIKRIDIATLRKMRLTKHKNGRIYIGGYSFENSQEILDRIQKILRSPYRDALVKEGFANTWLLALVVQMADAWSMEKYGWELFDYCFVEFDWQPDDLDNPVFLERGSKGQVNSIGIDCVGFPDRGLQVGFTLYEFGEFLDDEASYKENNRSYDLDTHKLALAVPEATIFNTSYPLNKSQAKVLSTVLSSIHLIDLDVLFQSLLPSYVEARGASISRQTFEKTASSDEMFDMALIDKEELEDYATVPGMLTTLPTLKECMSQGFNQGG